MHAASLATHSVSLLCHPNRLTDSSELLISFHLRLYYFNATHIPWTPSCHLQEAPLTGAKSVRVLRAKPMKGLTIFVSCFLYCQIPCSNVCVSLLTQCLLEEVLCSTIKPSINYVKCLQNSESSSGVFCLLSLSFFLHCIIFFNRLRDILQQIFHMGVCGTIIINARKLYEGLPALSKLALAEKGKINGGRVKKKAAIEMT